MTINYNHFAMNFVNAIIVLGVVYLATSCLSIIVKLFFAVFPKKSDTKFDSRNQLYGTTENKSDDDDEDEDDDQTSASETGNESDSGDNSKTVWDWPLPPISFPRLLKEFTVYSQKGVDIVEEYYAWVHSTPEQTQFGIQLPELNDKNANFSNTNLCKHRYELEDLLDSNYNHELMWTLIDDTHSTTTHKHITSAWMHLVKTTLVQIIKIDLDIINQLKGKEQKTIFVTTTLIPLLIKYKDVYISSTIFDFGTPCGFYKAVLKKMIEFVNLYGILEPMILIACIYSNLINEDCHPTITGDGDTSTSLVMRHHKFYGPLVHKLPLRFQSVLDQKRTA